jgi:large conductance mechanosensitive channel
MKLLSEFKAFAMRGNVMDMAVGIIIGGAFGKIVGSLVSDVLMPPIGMLIGGLDLSDFKITMKDAVLDAAGNITTPAATISYGIFVNTIINFVIVAFAIFMVIKLMNMAKKKEEAKPAPAPAPAPQELLLAEIRDILKSKS